MNADLEYIAAILEDYCDLQTSGQISGANRYPVADVMEQVSLLFTQEEEEPIVQRVLMDDVTYINSTIVIVTTWGAVPFSYEGDESVLRLIKKLNDPSEIGKWGTWSEEDLENCYDVSSRYL